MNKFFKKINFVERIPKLKWKRVLSLLLSIFIIIVSAMGIVKLVKKSEETEKKIYPTFSVGSLNASDGLYKTDSDKSTIYTKDSFECKGLKISVDFDATITYQVYLYDENGDFLYSTSFTKQKYELNDNYVRYARVVVKPDDDDNILFFEVLKYSTQVHIEVMKNQTFVAPETIELTNKCTLYNGKSAVLSADDIVGVISGSNVGCKVLNCTGFAKVKLTWKEIEKSTAVTCYFANADNELVGTSVSITANQTEQIINVPNGATRFYISYAVGHVPSVYQTK